MDTKDLAKIIDKMDGNHKELSGTVSNIDKTLVIQAEQLTYHIKRTDLLEEVVRDLRGSQQVVQKHVHKVEVIWKFLCWALGSAMTIFGIVMAIYKAIS